MCFFRRSKNLLPFLPPPEEKSLEPFTLLIVTKKIKIYINADPSPCGDYSFITLMRFSINISCKVNIFDIIIPYIQQ